MAQIPIAAGRFHLALDGKPCGFLRSVEGGSIRADVVTEPASPEPFLRKHLGPVAPEPIVVTFGFSMSPPVYDWINASWAGKTSPRDGSIVFADAALKPVKELVFHQGLITEIAFPAADGASKEAAFLTVTIQPERTQTRKASGKLAAAAPTKGREWLASDFRVEIAGLDAERVVRVGAFTVETRPAAKIDFPSLRFTLAEKDAASWVEWHEDFVVQGNCDEAHEKTGALVLLGANLKKELLRLELEGLGIYRLAPAKAAAGAKTAGRLEAELYCERMTLAL